MISINSVQISTPSEFSTGVLDITKSERNANGNMIIELIATKRKLELKYNYLSNADLSTLFTVISPITFTVAYPDPLTGAERSGTFYKGDRNSGMIIYENGVPKWKDITFNFIEV